MSLSEEARKQGALWSVAATDWLQIQESTALPVWIAALDYAAVASGTRLLDAGCGSGGASVMAVERGAIVSACDTSEGLLSIARERLPQADLRLAEIEALPWPDASLDVVLAVNSIQFTTDPARAAREFVRVIAPGGRIAVAVWSAAGSEQRHVFVAIRALFDKPPQSRGAFTLSDPGEVEALFLGLPTQTHEIDCVFRYPNLETALQGQMSAGPSHRAIEIFGREKVESVIRTALHPFVTSSGEVSMRNRFRCIVITR